MERIAQLQRWLEATLGHASFRLLRASDDASFRRYFRVHFDDGSRSLVAMDAPTAHEDCRPFIHVATLFAAAGVNVPRIHAQDLAQGFLLLSDLGSTTYLEALDDASADRLYLDAIDALVRIQRAGNQGELPEYDRGLLRRELMLFPDWYCARQLQRDLTGAQREALERSFELLLANALAQPKVNVHRDYHSRNLMLTEPNPGILDFQDAVFGPITYDLVSLLRDAYIAWPEERVLDWCVRYWERARRAGLPVAPDFSEFYRDFEWMGAQRQLKVLGIFARLCLRDGKPAYLRDQPLVMRYLRQTCARYRELGALSALLDELEPQATVTGYTF